MPWRWSTCSPPCRQTFQAPARRRVSQTGGEKGPETNTSAIPVPLRLMVLKINVHLCTRAFVNSHEIVDEVVEDVPGEDGHGARPRHLLRQAAQHDAHVPVAVLGAHPRQCGRGGKRRARGDPEGVVKLEYRLLKLAPMISVLCLELRMRHFVLNANII